MPQLNSATKTFLLGLSVSALILVSFFGGALADRVFVIKPLDYWIKRAGGLHVPATSDVGANSQLGALITSAEDIADVAEKTSASVVTISIKQQQRTLSLFDQSIFGLFGQDVPEGQVREVQQDIGTGFVANDQGLIVTNKHVVSVPTAQYSVFDKDDKEYQVSNIYRDPNNDLAILKIEGASLPPLPLGDSDKIRVGQTVIAIGTALGEFRHTVTTGVVSGLGRGIQAGDFSGRVVESLDDVIQTDAAINPGNSGGPLLDRAGSVIGVSVAVSQAGQNIGFALPINVVKASINNFNQTGQFNRPFMGIRYRTITEQAALFNEVPQGAYLLEVVDDSSAAVAGLRTGDIITEFDGQKIKGDVELSSLINSKKVGDQVSVKYWRNGEEATLTLTLRGSNQ